MPVRRIWVWQREGGDVDLIRISRGTEADRLPLEPFFTGDGFRGDAYPCNQTPYFFFSVSSTGTFGPGFELSCSDELASAGDSASFGCPAG